MFRGFGHPRKGQDDMARRFARALGVITAGVMALGVLLPATASAEDRIYWSRELFDTGSPSIRFGPLTGDLTIGTGDDAQTLYSDSNGPCGVAANPAAGLTGKVYWANWGGGIMSANLNGSGGASELFPDTDDNLCGVAVDPNAGTIYWANFSDDQIWRGNLNGSGATLLFTEPGPSDPSGVAIDPANNKIYWTNQHSNEVRVGNLDGSGTASTLFGTDIPVAGNFENNPIGVAVDSAAGKIYWTNLNSGEVRSGNVNGTGATTLFNSPTPSGPAIDPIAGKIYWSSWTSGNGIRVGSLDGSGVASTLFNGEGNALFTAILKSPENTGKPAISGGAKTGKNLTCENGSWAPDLVGAFLYRAPTSFAYEWRRNGGPVISEGQTFTPQLVGDYTCTVTATNEAGSTSRVSSVKKVKDK